MLELSQRRTVGAPQTRYAVQSQQPRKLMVALVLLLVALVAVLVKDRQFWFGSEESVIESDVPAAPASLPVNAGSVPSSTPAQPAKTPVASAKTSSQPATPAAPAVTATRTVLPPLELQVVAGSNQQVVRPSNKGTKVQISKAPAIEPEQPAASVTNRAAEHEAVPAGADHLPQTEMHTTYPLLAKHMNVQGSVVMEAVINADGTIQNLRILSGVSILASAAQQAVREWRFKPIYQNGQPVESKAKITVNFTIKVGDSIPGNTLAQSANSDQLIISR
jgi:protein TonB